ncbi:MAG TPA: tetratricopeptide repeat protein [Alphaproteobacteria bacterium]|nr:tetratricopeptide repeat protein [Alphaproteobacteria bacterium]
MKPTTAIRRRLARIGKQADGDIDLTEAAMVLASIDHPGGVAESYHRHLNRLARDVGAYAGGPQEAAGCALGLRRDALRQVVAKRYGYAGSEEVYGEKEGANLMRVIDRRRGLPVVLGLIYMHVAGQLGWSAQGLDFPARFVVRLDFEGKRLILDPFAGGRTLEARDMRDLYKAVAGNQAELTPDQYRPVGNRNILLRIQNNVKVRYMRAERLDEALDTIELMLLFAPAEAALWREAGLLNARLDRVKEAVRALEEYLRHQESEAGRYRTSVLLRELRGRLG